jgi:CheY-like chemotaxis protein
MPDETVGLLLSRDLIFTSKVTGTARALGHVVLVAGDRAVASRIIEERSPRVVFIDLAAGDLGAAPALTALKEAAGPKIPFVAFGSHVDTQALDAARAAGCALVLPRSRFSAELPQLIERFLGAGPINHTDEPGSVMPN